jgi:RNA polymerase sigma factor (sigma-70 family)
MIPDGELLRRYTETNSESAFTELVERHLALVYSAALRQVNGDAHLAQDVAQTVFAELARKAASLAGRPVLTGWLYTTAHFAAVKAVRTERRRQMHEEEAQLMNQLLCDPAPDLDWEKLRPVLDAAMLELNEPDREAVLLRYFDNRPHAEIANRLGLSENAARMRVERALEKLHSLLGRCGVSTTAALSAVILANAVQVAPGGLAATLSTAALAGTTLATVTAATAAKTIAMTTLQKTVIATVLITAVGTGVYEARQAAKLREQIQSLEQQRTPMAEQIQQLQRERNDATNKLTGLREDNERLNRNTAELLRLRGQVTQLRATTSQNESDPTESAAKSWLTRVNQLKERLEQTPGAQIPELKYLTAQDWLNAARNDPKSENDFRLAFSSLRTAAAWNIGHRLEDALKKYSQSNNGQFASDLSQLQAYLDAPIDAAILQRYAIMAADSLPSIKLGGDWVIALTVPVDIDYDQQIVIGPNGSGSTSFKGSNEVAALAPALRAYAESNNGQEPKTPSDLLPYLTTPEQQAAYQKLEQMNRPVAK